MKHILFINPPFKKGYSRSSRSPAVTKSGTLYYPVLLSYAAALLEKNNYKISMIDAIADNYDEFYILDKIYSIKPDSIVIDTSVHSKKNDLIFSEKIKKNFSDVLVGIVGTLPTIEITKNFFEYKFDFAIIGEYDSILLNLFNDFFNSNQLIKNDCLYWNINHKDENFVEPEKFKSYNLDEYPFISKFYNSHLDIKKYFYSAARKPIVTILTSRGCPNRCSFCLYPQLINPKLRFRTIDNVVKEFQYIAEKLSFVKEIFIEDDTFNTSEKRIRDFAEGLININNKIPFSFNARANISEHNLKLLKQANCRLIVIGVESGNQTTLDKINKNITVEEIKEFIRLTKKYKILVHSCYILGYPWENEEDFKQTIDFAIELNTDTAQFFPLMIYKNTKIFKKLERNINFLNDYLTSEGLHSGNFENSNFDRSTVIKYCNLARKKYYIRLDYIFYKLKQIIFSPEELRRTVKSFVKFYKYLLK